jgi:hypothetical protein
MRIKTISLSMIFVLLNLILLSTPKSEAATAVSVTIPTFQVRLNDVIIDNAYSQYPLIVYKDITYFPMTYYDSRFMGLESLWDNTTGLEIVKTGGNWDYHKYPSTNKNSRAYSAQIAPFKIEVNGQLIDNKLESYPLLLFRNITYFPLTWRYAVNEFGWQYAFDTDQGLEISTSGGNISVKEVKLPIVQREMGEKGAFVMAGDYYYFEGVAGKIYQAPISNPQNIKFVYQLPLSDSQDAYVYASLYEDDNQAFLKYHTGGAIMGSDHLIKLNATLELDNGYSNYKIFDAYTVRVEQGFPPSNNNLMIKKNSESKFVKIGNPEFTYGLFIKHESTQTSAHSNNDLCLIDGDIYVLGYEGLPDDPKAGTTGIYKVNVETNKTSRLCSEEAESFKIVADMIYFLDGDSRLYRVPLTGGKAEIVVDKPVDFYQILNENIFYSLTEDDLLRVFGKSDIINRDGKLVKLEQKDNYLIALFDGKSRSAYELMVFDQEGAIRYKTYENFDLVGIQNDEIVIVKNK